MTDIAQIRRESRIRRHRRVRKKVHGTAERPRLAVFRSNKHLVAQVIDDDAGRTLAAASTAEADQRAAGSGSTVEAAARIGQLVAERAKAAGIEQVVFDRGGFIYHGRIAAARRGRPRGRSGVLMAYNYNNQGGQRRASPRAACASRG